MTTELQELEISAVALVDNPANPLATVELFKRDTVRKQTLDDLQQRLQTAVQDRFGSHDDYLWLDDVELDDGWLVYCSDGHYYKIGYGNTADGTVSLVGDPVEVVRETEYQPLTKANEPRKLKEAAVADPISKEEHAALATKLAEAEATLKALTDMTNDDLAALRGIELAKAAPEPEDVLKSLPDDVRKRLEDAETAVAKMQADARARDFIAKAADYSHIAGAAELGPVLEEIDRKAPEAAKSIEQYLKAADARIAEGGLFKEFGSDGDAADDPESRATALVDKFVADGMDRPAAITKVFTENPDLFRPAGV